MKPDPHIADDDLILALDGELPEPRQGEVNAHLLGCWECRARRARLERAIEDFLAAQPHELPGAAPAAGPTARLRAALAMEVEKEQSAPAAGWRTAWMRRPRALLAGAVAAMMVPGALAMRLSARPTLAATEPSETSSTLAISR